MADFSPQLKEKLEALNDNTQRLAVAVGKRLDTLEHGAADTGGLSERIEEVDNHARKRYDELDFAIHNTAAPPPPDMSELFTALVAAQLEIKNAEANIENEFLTKRYADLASVMDAVREPLAKNGLTIIQLTATKVEVAEVDESPSAIGIKTILAHVSGRFIEDVIAMVPPKNDPQGIGSCRTYMRRYGVLGICAIAGAIDDDAEGTKASGDDYERITKQEAEFILVKADELFGERADAALAKMLDRLFGGITRVGDIKAGEADVAVTNLENGAELMAKNAEKKAAEEKKLADGEKAAKAEADEGPARVKK